jgi:hypothetical protein
MLIGEFPAQGIKIGQRWQRKDPSVQSVCIIEIEEINNEYQIYGNMIQLLAGPRPNYISHTWTYDLHDSPCEYTYLVGQDKT